MSPEAVRPEALLAAWVDALGDGRPEVVRAGRDVLERYTEPHRRYHDLRHLGEVLAALGVLSEGRPLAATVLCAAFFHDAVYERTAYDDEQRSADLAGQVLRRLGWAAAPVAQVVRLVLLTATHDPAPDDEAGALLCDADLAVLAAAPERYLAYAADVRHEYAHLDDEAFRAGRAAVLRELAGRPRLFTTPLGHRRWDERARQNLRGELAQLDAGPPP